MDNISMKPNKAMQEHLAKLSAAADTRKIHADAIAVHNGYRDGAAAFRGMGKAFIALVQKTAPSINTAMQRPNFFEGIRGIE